MNATRDRRRLRRAWCALIVLAAALVGAARTARVAAASGNGSTDATDTYRGDRILTFGGGSSPQNSQASLEQNVLYFRRVLTELKLGDVRQDVFFTDGNKSARTVQVRGAPSPALEARQAVATLFGDDADDLQLRFRPPAIPSVIGPSTPGAIGNWFDTSGKAMRPSERLLIYFTGHGAPIRRRAGGGGRRGNPGASSAILPTGTLLETWNNTAISTKDFILQLDKLNPRTDVTLVMVQCFSGGFANVIYNEGDPAKGFSRAHRCGFFSTIATRPAAGCTADIDGDDYQEFSTAFFAALCGKTRAGAPIERPDYDHDGVTTFTEAFTYVLLTSNTIDIPMTTSDQLLRDRSRLSKGGIVGEGIGRTEPDFSTLLAAATPSQKAALEGLSSQLGLSGEQRMAAARRLASDLERERRDAQKATRDAESEMNNQRNQIRAALVQRWPEFAVRWHPETETLLANNRSYILEMIQNHPSFKSYDDARNKRDRASDRDETLERKWVKVQRLLARAETVMLAENLEKVASPETVEFYKDLVARENESLTSWKSQAR